MEPQLQEAAARNFVIVFAMDKGRVDYPIASRATQHWHAITTATRMKPPCISQGLRLKAVLHTVIDFESEELKLYWPALLGQKSYKLGSFDACPSCDLY